MNSLENFRVYVFISIFFQFHFILFLLARTWTRALQLSGMRQIIIPIFSLENRHIFSRLV